MVGFIPTNKANSQQKRKPREHLIAVRTGKKDF